MKLLSEAAGRLKASPRALAMLLTTAFGLIIPRFASAAEGDVVLNFSSQDKMLLVLSLVFGVIAILVAFAIRSALMKESPGSEKMREVGLAIREGAQAYLGRQIKTMIWFVLALCIGLFFLFQGQYGPVVSVWISVAFVMGVAASYTAGYAGMIMAVNGNMRTANAALTSYKKALEIAFRSGAVAGLLTVGLGLIGATIIILAGGKDAMRILVGFGFGGSLAALFMRVGGGIFTKAADVGADLVGKVEAGIPEDDPRNPATIADNVGDNVGDCAGMAADIFESYEVTLVAAILLGAATSVIFDQTTWMRLVLFALMARGVGIIASIFGIFAVKGTDDIDSDPLMRIRKGFYSSAIVAAVLTAGLAFVMMGGTGKPITTTQLTNELQIELDNANLVQMVRNDVALKRSTKTTVVEPWQVSSADIVGDPRLANLDRLQPASPTVDDQTNRLQNIDSWLQLGPRLEQPPVALKLEGYTKLTPDSTNPAMGYVTQKMPMTVADQQNPAFQPPNMGTIGDIVKNGGDLVVCHAKVTTKAATAPGQTTPAAPTTSTMNFGPINKKFLDDIMANGAKQGTVYSEQTYYPAAYYADPEGRIAIGIEGAIPDRLTLNPALPSQYFPVDMKTFTDARAKTQADPKAPGPIAKVATMAFVSHNTVPWYMFLIAIVFGLFMAFAIEYLTDYYVSTHKRPTQEVAGVSSAGAAPMIIQGFAYGLESSVFMVFAIVIALLVPLFLFSPVTYGTYILSFYGIALVGLGLLTTTGYVLAMDTFGPISDNAQGVYEMSGEGHDNEYGSKAVQRLDAAGNTTKALTKGFAIATAVVAAVALFHTYLESAHLQSKGLPLDIPQIFLGLMIGGAAPYLFSAFAINAVGRASFQLINEVRRQFKADAGILAGTSKPDYGRCVAIVTAAAQKELLGPGILAIALPVAVAFGFSIGQAPSSVDGRMFNLTGAQALGGYLAGAILSGQLMAVLLANSGGMWDNAKKLIEDGLYGGKGSEAHKAGVVCDTVGDPFKDTAGPALNPLIKVMNLVALLLAPIIIMPFGNGVLITVTAIALAALTFSIYFSKKGSMSTALMEAQSEGAAAGDHLKTVNELPHAPDAAVRRKITVEDATGDKVDK
jgi:K(+)-stimulated pyrophosphate-energized sodium pump